MIARTWWTLCLVVGLWACSGDGSEPLRTADGGAPDAAEPEADAEACPSGGGTGSLAIEVVIEDEVDADVRVTAADGRALADFTETASRSVPAGTYSVSAHRVRSAGALVGPAYQGRVQASDEVCVRAGATTDVRVVYTREPGSARLWLTQSNGDGAQVMAFDADQLEVAGEQSPSVSLAPALNSVGPIRVDGLGRLWVGSTTGVLVAFESGRLGTSSTQAPSVVIDGPAICGASLPCGPRSMAFDARGALWVALLDRIVMLAPESLLRTGKPSAEVTLTSPDIHTPEVLAFDAEGNLWVGDSDGAIVRFDEARLDADVEDEAADVVIFTQTPGPVMGGLSGPAGMAFDATGNLWVGFFAGNELIRLTPSELATSAPAFPGAALIPSVYFRIDVGALVTDLGIDEAGNLWMPGGSLSSGAGALYRIDAAQLSAETPEWVVLSSAGIGSAERLTLNTVAGATFIAP